MIRVTVTGVGDSTGWSALGTGVRGCAQPASTVSSSCVMAWHMCVLCVVGQQGLGRVWERQAHTCNNIGFRR